MAGRAGQLGNRTRRGWRRRGVSAIEYAAILGLMAVLILMAVLTIGRTTTGTYGNFAPNMPLVRDRGAGTSLGDRPAAPDTFVRQ